jgi:hypothetical protein
MNIRKFAILVSLLAVLVAGTVLSARAETPMQVSGFQVAYAAGHINTSMQVLDALSSPVARAKVQVSFEKDGSRTILRSGKTSASGFVSIAASVPSGNWKVCVEEIHKRGFDYSPATNLCTSISVP